MHAMGRAVREVVAHISPHSLGAKLVFVLTLVGSFGAAAIMLLLASVITPSFNHLEARSLASQRGHASAVLDDMSAEVERSTRNEADRIERGELRFGAEPSSSAGADHSARRRFSMFWYGAGGAVSLSSRSKTPASPTFAQRMRRLAVQRALAGRRSTRFFVAIGPDLVGVAIADVRRRGGGPTAYVGQGIVVGERRLSTMIGFPAHVERVERVDAGDAGAAAPAGHAAIRVALPGEDGRKTALVAFDVPQDISLLGRRMLILAGAGSTLLLILLLAILRRMITRLVLRPLHLVEQQMHDVRPGAITRLEDDPRRDEIGSLSRSFNAMLRQLNALGDQIERQSFALGRSESAVAVMHNVRNALNPISTILSRGIAQPQPADRALLARAVAELACDDVAPARRAGLAAFVGAALEVEARDDVERRRQLQIGRDALGQLLEIIGDQQAAANERPDVTTCDLTEIVARSASIAAYATDASIGFTLPDAPCPVIASRPILAQVIGNLLGNAVEAIGARGGGKGWVTVTSVRDGNDPGGRVIVTIRDDGEGFEPSAAATLFQRGYSTRRSKSGGLGLHWCANAVAAMHGSLTLDSEGQGRGAVAQLIVPAATCDSGRGAVLQRAA